MNAKQYKFDRLKQTEKLNPEQKQTRLMRELQDKLKLSKLPYHIECFDNSNISGSDAVAGCIVYKGMKPSKKDYRKYNIKTVVGPDDYASMQEVVRRRYSRMQEEGTPLPDLIITDGGKGQMEVVREVVEDELHLSDSNCRTCQRRSSPHKRASFRLPTADNSTRHQGRTIQGSYTDTG